MAIFALICVDCFRRFAAMGAKRAASSRSIASENTGLRVIEHPAVSPDGRFVAFTERASREDGEPAHAAIWLAPLDGGTPQRITWGINGDELPRWHPDSMQVGFLSD